MSRTRTRLVLAALLALGATVGTHGLSGQEPRPLTRNTAIDGTLTADSRDRYVVELADKWFVFGQVDQIDVDVVVTITGPDGRQIASFDGPARGPEAFQFETRAAGRHVIEVTPFERATGSYRIRLVQSERVATDARRRVDQMMAPWTGTDVPGGVVGIIEDGRLRLVRAYGMANLEHAIPFTERTISNIGSVTKQFTAMGLLLLEADGKLSLEDDIREHIPELPDFGAITLRNLLNHTGGYREIYNLLPMSGRQPEDAILRDEAIRIVQRQPELQAKPNTAFNYNNTGYILLATVIERVSGMMFPAYMKARVFEPLGMADTRVASYQGEVIPGSAQGYVAADDGRYRSTRDLAASYGAGGIYTTVRDLSRWMLNYAQPTLGGPAAIAAITTNTVLENGDSTGYGLGLGLGKRRGRTIWTHTGGDNAHRTYFGYYPELRSGIILMSNNGGFDLTMANRIANAFFEDRFERDTAPVTNVAGGVAVSPELLEALSGAWVLGAEAGLEVELSVDNGVLISHPVGQRPFQLTPTSDSTFTYQGVEASVTFHFDADRSANRATHHQGGDIPMRRVERAPPPTVEKLADYTGRYWSEELETFYEIRVEDGALAMHHPRIAPIRLTHREGEEFTGSGFPFSTVTFRRAGNGTVTGFATSNSRTMGVWFQRR